MLRIPPDQLVPARQYARAARDSLIDLFATMKRTGKGDARKEQESIRRAAERVAERLGRYHVPPSLKQLDEKLRAALGQTIAAATLAQEGIDAGDVGRITKASELVTDCHARFKEVIDEAGRIMGQH